MAYDTALADRLREIMGEHAPVAEKRMFGGLAFMVDRHLVVAASSQGGLMLRVDPARTPTLVADGRADRVVMKGREMDGWLHVHLDASVDETELRTWVEEGLSYAATLPPR